MCFPIHHGKRLGETLKLPRLSRVSGALTSRSASQKLQCLVSVSSQTISSRSRRHGSWVSSWSRLRRSRAHPCCAYPQTNGQVELTEWLFKFHDLPDSAWMLQLTQKQWKANLLQMQFIPQCVTVITLSIELNLQVWHLTQSCCLHRFRHFQLVPKTQFKSN